MHGDDDAAIFGDDLAGAVGQNALRLGDEFALFSDAGSLDAFWPWSICSLGSAEIKGIRRHSLTSRSQFAGILNVPEALLVAWEEGSRQPDGAALLLLTVLQRRGLSALASLARGNDLERG